ncbi:hypothetical protein RhiirC2_62838 [Rhizophagus irregularis]|uniref:Uncharacterized protein n=1 Tax=Rhizophagus irregularis TaxID=588596 RepID=A0A2N1MV84_9GLOM|nr:hypothetical protein RhiirC2_62838 [Rhizophagus irregularis]
MSRLIDLSALTSFLDQYLIIQYYFIAFLIFFQKKNQEANFCSKSFLKDIQLN